MSYKTSRHYAYRYSDLSQINIVSLIINIKLLHKNCNKGV